MSDQRNFVHLHMHMEGSVADSILHCNDAAKRAKEYGMPACAITDHGYLFKVVDFYMACKKQGVKPIIGVETYVAPRSNRLKEHGVDNANYHLVLLCENEEGYHNLMAIVSDAAVDGMYYRPRTDKDWLKKHAKGLIALSACVGGEVQQFILKDQYELAKQSALQYQDIFGVGNFFLELQDHGMEEQAIVNKALLRMHKETGIPLVATNDSHYLDRSSSEAHDILMAIQEKKKVTDTNRKRYPSDQFYFKSQEEMWHLFSHVPEALENTVKIAERCNVEFELGVNKIPQYPDVPPPYTADGFLKKLSMEGAKERYKELTDDILERIEYELSVVIKMQYTDYFLIMWDLFNFARRNNIFVGPGRGSGAGSILLYSLYVTQLDPLEHDLLFERFLDPSRISMPDVDTDWPDDRRAEVIDYIVEKYGQSSIAQIITFGRIAPKGGVRSVGRATERDILADKIARLIPEKPNMTWERAMREAPELKTLYDTNPEAKHIMDIAAELDGIPTYMGTHAAGVLIADNKGVTGHVPICKTDKGIVSQFDMDILDTIGMLKVDILGLGTLTVIVNAIANIKENYDLVIDPYRLYSEIDDKVFSTIAAGYTEGIFQLEGDGMTNFMKNLQPDCLDDIIAGVALYRPGPMDMIPQYIEGKQHPETVHYDFPELESIFKETNGVMVYQEQCMRSAIVLAGYQKHHSDSLRKGIGKKKKDIIAMHRNWFIYGKQADDSFDQIPGGIQMGHDQAELERFYDKMERFGEYCFNKSHAACYAILAYVTAWLKTYYPVEFMASLMAHNAKDHNKLSRYIKHCKNDLQIIVKAPSVNQSDVNFHATKEGQLLAALFVKDTEEAVLRALVEERAAHGPYLHILDFLQRTKEFINKTTLKALSSVGAFDEFGLPRSSWAAGIEEYMECINKWKSATKRYLENPNSRRKTAPDLMEWVKDVRQVFPDIKEYPDNIKLRVEKEYMGIYFSGHPLTKFRCSIDAFSNISLLEMQENADTLYHDRRVFTICQVHDILRTATRKDKKPMAITKITDLEGTGKLMIVPQIYHNIKNQLEEDGIYKISGKLSIRNGEEPILIPTSMEPLKMTLMPHLIFRVDAEQMFQIPEWTELLRRKNRQHQITAKAPVYFEYEGKRVLLKKQYWTDPDLMLPRLPETLAACATIEKW